MKIIRIVLIVTVFVTIQSAHAQVFKCTFPSGKVLFQDDECPSEAQQDSLKIKQMTPEQRVESEARLKQWQLEQDEKESRIKKAEQERRAENARLEEVEALKRSANAQEDLAETKRRELELLQQQPLINLYQPYYPLTIPYRDRDWRQHRKDYSGDKNYNKGPVIDRNQNRSVNQGITSDSVNIISRPRR
ncbi:MAG: hypothetical protein Q7U30_14865 [Methylicorpusculum sp.]|nr:hypothetical protein [Methylicorpusculum sp.]